ncbi:MAG: DUF4920 domain-containing protein [Saprospiraceae bacterium]
MKKFQFFFFLLPVFAVCISCSSKPVAVGDSFGAGVANRESAVAFSDVMQKLEASDSVKVVMKAKVSEVCQAKGCWMNLVDPVASTDKKLVVKFKDYAFFVPKDIAGREVIVEGTAFKELTPVSELRHYAEDAGKSEAEIAEITEPVTEMKFMATGVVVL